MARENIKIKVGYYAGDGADNKNITGVGFKPDLVIVKGGARNSPFRTKTMLGDSSGFLNSTTANSANYIQELQNDGFQVGSTTNVNESGINQYYIAIKGTDSQNYFRVGKYLGSGADDRNFTDASIDFTPDLVIIKGDTAQQAVFYSLYHSGDTSCKFDANSNGADIIQALASNGFQLGTDARVNTAGLYYYYVAIKQLTGAIAVGTYTGNATARSITGLGFKPDAVIVKANTTTAARLYTSDMVTLGASSLYMNVTAADTTGITSLDSDGFSVSTGDSVNKNATAIYWMAFKSGNFEAPISRTAVS